jgi:hypothetical protein
MVAGMLLHEFCEEMKMAALSVGPRAGMCWSEWQCWWTRKKRKDACIEGERHNADPIGIDVCLPTSDFR